MNSPTGHNPIILWSPAQHDRWDRMRADNHPWFQIIIGNASRDTEPRPPMVPTSLSELTGNASFMLGSAAGGKRYATIGRWEALAYLITGDRVYGRSALEIVYMTTSGFDVTKPYESNGQREYGTELVWLYDVLKPVMAPAEDAAYLAWLKATQERTLEGVRFGDSDQLIGCYMALGAMDRVAGTNYLSRTILDTDNSIVRPVGGAIATGANIETMRNRVRFFTEVMAAGGQWIESPDYNLGTPLLLYMGAEAIGRDFFPEVKAFRKAHATYLKHEMTPDLKDFFSWGDEEHPHDLAWHARHDLYETVPALLELDGETAAAAEFRQFADDVRAANGQTFTIGGQPLYARAFYWADPWAARAPWKANAGKTLITRGTGHAYARSGWEPTDRAFHLHCTNWANGGVDHMMPIHGDVTVYDNGRWVLGHPLAYMPDVWYQNMVVMSRYGSSTEYGEIVAAAARDDAFLYAAGSNAGAPPFWSWTMPTDLSESTRHVYIPLDDPAGALVVIVIDRLHATDPRARANWETLYTYPQNVDVLRQMRAVKDVTWHAPVQPTLLADGAQWAVDDRTVQLRTLTPAMTYEVVDERSATNIGGYINPEEKKFALHAVPAAAHPFDVVVTAFTVTRGAQAVQVDASVNGQIAAVRIRRPGKLPQLFIVGATPGAVLESIDDGTGHNAHDFAGRQAIVRAGRLIKDGFPLALTETTRIRIADLDPTVQWDAPGLTRIGDLAELEALPGLLNITANGAAVETPPDPGPQPGEDDYMDNMKAIDGLIADMNLATNRIASRLDAQAQQIELLKTQVSNGTPVTLPQLDGIVASLTAERDRLNALGANPSQPIPPTV